MVNRVSVRHSVPALIGLLLILAEGFLFLGGSFGEYESRLAQPWEPPEPLTLNFFPYSFLAAGAILAWIFAAFIAGASIDRDQFSIRRLWVAAAALVLSSILLGVGLLLVVTIEMQSDNIVWYTTGAGAYVLIALPLVAAVALGVATVGPPEA